METNGLHSDLTASNLACQCGVVQDAFEMDGSTTLDFPLSVNEQFESDFTMSFYFQMENVGENVDILSLQRACANIDSSLTVKYNNSSQTINVEMAEGFAKLVDLSGPLNESQCWHHFVLARKGLEYFLYLDDELVDVELANGSIALADSTTLKFSNGPCNEIKLDGRIDEFQFHDQFLEGLALNALNLTMDRILNKDTTIFLGDFVQIQSGNTCANSFSWSPTNGISDTNITNPEMSPTETTTYFINFFNGFCSSLDSVTVYVLDPNNLECENLLLPSAFTPNGDGLNDEYGISNNFIIEEMESFEIFDRWGEKVFSTTNKQEKWDGSYKNTILNPGMFLYKINYRCVNESYSKVGNFSIIR